MHFIRFDRRALCFGIATAAWPFASLAQQPRAMRRIGVLSALSEDDPEAKARVAAFRQALQALGWREGSNVQIDVRWGAGDRDRLGGQAAALVAQKPDVLFAGSGATLVP